MADELTKQKMDEYVNGGHNNCPYCNSDTINCSYDGKDDNFVECEVECEDCGKIWREIYTLTTIIEKQ